MYKFYLDGVLLPLAPESLTMKIKDKDETVDLMNGGTLSILNSPGLTTFDFDFLLPANKLPFAQYDGGYHDPEYYLSHLEKLKTSKKPFQFIVIRWEGRNLDTINNLKDTNMTVSLSEYEVEENAESYGMGRKVKVTLQQYIKYSTKKIIISADKSTIIIENNVDRNTTDIVGTVYEVKEGDTLMSISQKYFGTPDHWVGIADLNSIERTVDTLIPGMILSLDKSKITLLTEAYNEEVAKIVGDTDE